MAPGATLPVESHSPPNGNTTKSRNSAPLTKVGALDAAFAFDELTPAIGREYPDAKIVEDILNAPNSDDLLRDLAITSEYGPMIESPATLNANCSIWLKLANEASYSFGSKTA
jgi:hypothetical protein